MNRLVLDRNVAMPDDLYAKLVALTEGLGPDEALRAYARLVLVLANQIGDADLVAQAVALARDPHGGCK